MKKLFLSFTFLIFSLTLLAQTEQAKKSEEAYTKDFLIKFAQALYTEKENPKEALKIYEELYAQAPQDSILLKSLATLCTKTDNKTCWIFRVDIKKPYNEQITYSQTFPQSYMWIPLDIKPIGKDNYYLLYNADKNGGKVYSLMKLDFSKDVKQNPVFDREIFVKPELFF